MNHPENLKMKSLDYTIHPAGIQAPEFVMIGLHGRNANKYAFFPFVRQMAFLHTKWILPSATYASETSEDIRHWFDHLTHDSTEIALSRSLINDIIDAEIAKGILAENIFLIGFSQGAIMSVDTVLRYGQRLGGIVALSGYVANPELLLNERSNANHAIPIFWGHGTRDEIITVERGRKHAGILQEMGYDVDYHEYDSTHRIISQEVKDIRAFLHRHMYGMSIDEAKNHAQPIVPF
jgi:phospholipase/carboxylesterase